MFGANIWKIFDNATKNDNYFSRNYKIDTFLLQIITLAAKSHLYFLPFSVLGNIEELLHLALIFVVKVMCVAGLKSAEPIYAIMLALSWRASGYSCS